MVSFVDPLSSNNNDALIRCFCVTNGHVEPAMARCELGQLNITALVENDISSLVPLMHHGN